MEAQRRDDLERFVEQAGWPATALKALGEDASTRRYFRLIEDDRRAIVMDAPPTAESAICPPDANPEQRVALGYNALARLAGSDLTAFTAVASHLRRMSLSAPEILAMDRTRGFLILEDLGDDLFARVLDEGGDATALYSAAVDALDILHSHPVPDRLSPPDASPEWPLLSYDRAALEAETALFLDWYWKAAFSAPATDHQRSAFLAAWHQVLEAQAPEAPVLILRDFHAENLIWLPDREGAARVGLLDFQDAVSGSCAYDLVSLLTDARRDVAPELASAMIDRYVALRRDRDPHFDETAFSTNYAILSAQRTAKILGIFARLHIRDGKPRYLVHIPRLWRLMDEALTHPALQPVKAWFDAQMPAGRRGALADPSSEPHPPTDHRAPPTAPSS